jgi:hypothetical protein
MKKMDIGELADGYFTGKYSFIDDSTDCQYSDFEMSYLVESVFLRCIPKPVVLLEGENDSAFIIDGIKKVVSCNAFINGGLMLDGLKILTSYNGKKFDDLSDDEKTYFKGFEIFVEIVSKSNEKDIIERIIDLYREKRTDSMNNRKLRALVENEPDMIKMSEAEKSRILGEMGHVSKEEHEGALRKMEDAIRSLEDTVKKKDEEVNVLKAELEGFKDMRKLLETGVLTFTRKT